jgi:hypothetical protein
LIFFSISCLDVCLVKNLSSLYFGFTFDEFIDLKDKPKSTFVNI